MAQTPWYDYLSGAPRAEAARIDAQLGSARRQLRQAQTAAFASLDREKAALTDRILSEIRSAALSAISANQTGASAAQETPIRSLSASTLAARTKLIHGVTDYNSGAAGPAVALAKRVRELELERSSFIRKNVPDPGTPGFRSLIAARINALARRGADGSRLEAIGKSLRDLPAALSDNEKMRSYIEASGGDLSRPPRSDDLAGWRFLIDQAIQSRWLSILLVPDLPGLAKALSAESGLLEPLSTELAKQVSDAASDIESGEQAIESMRSYLPELYADLNAGLILVTAQRGYAEVPTAQKSPVGEITAALERSFNRYVSDVRSIAPGRLAVLVAQDPLFESLAGDTARTLNVVDRAQMVRFVRATGSDGLSVRIATAVLDRAYHDGHDRELAQFADSLNAAPAAASDVDQSYTQRLTGQAQKILQEASSALDESGDSQNRQWAFLSIMESRYAWKMLRTDSRFASLRQAFDTYVARTISDTDSLAASELAQSAAADAAPARVVIVPVVEYESIFREVAAYRERVSSNGMVVRDEIPVDRVWSAYASAFFQVSQGKGASSGAGPEAAKDWTLMHGQAAVNWQWAQAEPNAKADVVMNERLLNTFLHGVTEENNRQLSDRVRFLRGVVEPWIDAVRTAPAYGSDAVPGVGATPASNRSDLSSGGALPSAGILPADRSWERLATGFLMLRREIVQRVLSPIAGFGFVPREVLTDRERFTLELMNELDALTLSPPAFFSRLSTAWLGADMTQPDPAAASALAEAIVNGITGTADLAVQNFTNAARTASAFELRSRLTASPSETAAMYAERLYRRINSSAEQSRITVGDFRLYRDIVLANVRRIAERSGADRAAIGRLLSRLGLIRPEELRAMGAP